MVAGRGFEGFGSLLEASDFPIEIGGWVGRLFACFVEEGRNTSGEPADSSCSAGERRTSGTSPFLRFRAILHTYSSSYISGDWRNEKSIHENPGELFTKGDSMGRAI